MVCDVCGLPDNYRGQGDGIGSCYCPRCDCAAARSSVFCTCDPEDYDPDAGWGDGGEPWPDDVVLRQAQTIEPSEAYL